MQIKMRHFAMEVDGLEDVVTLLLRRVYKPYQLTLQSDRHDVTSESDPLDFGLGTVFVDDPDGNVVKFIERHRGIFAVVLG